jgi:hypothetical protein
MASVLSPPAVGSDGGAGCGWGTEQPYYKHSERDWKTS